jgi:hypothetical protein
MTRQRLRTIRLTGARAIIRSTSFLAIAIAAVVAGIGYVLPAHRLASDAHFHSNAADGGPLPLVVLAFVAAAAVLLRRLRIGAGMLTGMIGAGGAIAAVAPVLLAHLFSSVEATYGDHMFALGLLGMFFVGIALLIAEPILYVLERRSIQRAALPAPLPVAVAVRG